MDREVAKWVGLPCRRRIVQSGHISIFSPPVKSVNPIDFCARQTFVHCQPSLPRQGYGLQHESLMMTRDALPL
jgi:hypothetical protein